MNDELNVTGFIVPSNPETLKAIQSAVKEASNALFRIQAERDLIKEIAASMKDDHELAPADFNKLSKTYFKGEYQKLVDKNEQFTELYESIMAGVDPDLAP